MFPSKFKKYLFVVFLMISLSVMSGCWGQVLEIGNPTPEDFLDNPDADIFLWEDVVFLNAHDVDWVTKREYTLGDNVGEITKTTAIAKEFTNGTASKLPLGTKVYLVEGSKSKQVLIVVLDGIEIPYLAMLEG